jgi:hypothetical protein
MVITGFILNIAAIASISVLSYYWGRIIFGI